MMSSLSILEMTAATVVVLVCGTFFWKYCRIWYTYVSATRKSDVSETTQMMRQQHGINIKVISTVDDCVECINDLQSYYPQLLGMDCEWKPYACDRNNYNRVSLLQLCDNNVCLLIRLHLLDYIPLNLMSILNNPQIIKVGINISCDGKKLLNDYNINVCGCVDIKRFILNKCEFVQNNQQLLNKIQQSSLSNLSNMLLSWIDHDHDTTNSSNMNVLFCKDKKITLSNWECDQLSKHQIIYASNDAIFGYYSFVQCILNVNNETLNYKHINTNQNHNKNKIISDDTIDQLFKTTNIIKLCYHVIDMRSFKIKTKNKTKNITTPNIENAKEKKKKTIQSKIPTEAIYESKCNTHEYNQLSVRLRENKIVICELFGDILYYFSCIQLLKQSFHLVCKECYDIVYNMQLDMINIEWKHLYFQCIYKSPQLASFFISSAKLQLKNIVKSKFSLNYAFNHCINNYKCASNMNYNYKNMISIELSSSSHNIAIDLVSQIENMCDKSLPYSIVLKYFYRINSNNKNTNNNSSTSDNGMSTISLYNGYIVQLISIDEKENRKVRIIADAKGNAVEIGEEEIVLTFNREMIEDNVLIPIESNFLENMIIRENIKFDGLIAQFI